MTKAKRPGGLRAGAALLSAPTGFRLCAVKAASRLSEAEKLGAARGAATAGERGSADHRSESPTSHCEQPAGCPRLPHFRGALARLDESPAAPSAHSLFLRLLRLLGLRRGVVAGAAKGEAAAPDADVPARRELDLRVAAQQLRRHL